MSMLNRPAVPLGCGVGQPDQACGEPAVGALAVQVHASIGDAEDQARPAVLLLCVKHLAGIGGMAEAVFEPEVQQARGEVPLPPGMPTKGA
jgi:hypothetical protein